DWNRQAPARHTGQRNSPSEPRLGTASVHTVLDDHSRVADAEVHTDERAVIAIGVLARGRWVRRARCHRPASASIAPLADGCAYARFDSPETARRDALTGWPHFSNQH